MQPNPRDDRRPLQPVSPQRRPLAPATPAHTDRIYDNPAAPEPSGHYTPERRVSTNGMAVAALIFGILGFLLLPVIGSILAAVFGLIALRRIKRDHQEGRNLAITGLILAGVAFVILAALGGLWIYQGRLAAQRDNERRVALQKVATQLKGYYDNNGAFPSGDYSGLASDLTNTSIPHDPLASKGHPDYTYAPNPASCISSYANSYNASEGGFIGLTCSSYVLTATLEKGGMYTLNGSAGDTSASAKANDAKRKADIVTLVKALTEYYRDNNSYPQDQNNGIISCGTSGTLSELTTATPPILTSLPCDPNTTSWPQYLYTPSSDGSSYTLDACLEDAQDRGTNTLAPSNSSLSICPTRVYEVSSNDIP